MNLVFGYKGTTVTPPQQHESIYTPNHYLFKHKYNTFVGTQTWEDHARKTLRLSGINESCYEPAPKEGKSPPMEMEIITEAPSNEELQQMWTEDDKLIIATDGSVRNCGGTSYELSGHIANKDNTVTNAAVWVHGTGDSSYAAETRAILDAIKVAQKTPCQSITIATDCLSFLIKTSYWTHWDSRTEEEIISTAERIINSGRELTFRYVKSHAGNDCNEAVDQLLNDTWIRYRNLLSTQMQPTTKTKTEVTNAMKKKMERDETETRNTLRVTQDSKSSKNINYLQITHEKLKKWLQMKKDNRKVQSTIITTITDTAFRVKGDRLECP